MGPLPRAPKTGPARVLPGRGRTDGHERRSNASCGWPPAKRHPKWDQFLSWGDEPSVQDSVRILWNADSGGSKWGLSALNQTARKRMR